jgi:cytoskeletal protein CcmA (bactofilin family)
MNNNLNYINLNMLSNNSSFKGELNLSGESIISGSIEGQINVTDNSKITFEVDAVFSGILYAYDVEILGTFEGHLKSKGKVVVRPGARVTGNIQAQDLVIYPGSFIEFEGHTSNETL